MFFHTAAATSTPLAPSTPTHRMFCPFALKYSPYWPRPHPRSSTDWFAKTLASSLLTPGERQSFTPAESRCLRCGSLRLRRSRQNAPLSRADLPLRHASSPTSCRQCIERFSSASRSSRSVSSVESRSALDARWSSSSSMQWRRRKRRGGGIAACLDFLHAR